MNWRNTHFLRRAVALRAALGAAFLLTVIVTSCNGPNAPATAPSGNEVDFRGSYDTGGGALVFRLESPGGGTSPLQLVASNLTYDSAAGELHADVAIRNNGSVDVEGPLRVLVGEFDPPEVTPHTAEPLPCPMCPNCPCPWPWYFDHSGTFGDDGALAPGETSTPLEWVLYVPSGESFSFRARLERELTGPRPGVISGSVFVDANHNGRRDLGEVGIAGATISLLHGEVGASALTDARGAYQFEISAEGLYEISWSPELDCPPTTPLRRQVFIVRRPDGTLSGYDHADFGCGGNVPPDSLWVEVYGAVFEDLNRNGVRERNEPGLPGVRIEGSTPQCPTFAPIVVHTDAVGGYRMRLVRCAPPYVIHREPLAGFVDTTPNPVVLHGPTDPGPGPGVDPNPVPGTDPSEPPMPPVPGLRADFGVVRADSISDYSVEGFVYHDSNRNGRYDDDEIGIADVEVSASGLVCMIPVAGVTRTDSRGYYSLQQSEIHCVPPWSVGHDLVAEHCDTSPNPTIVGRYPGDPSQDPPMPRVFRVDFGVAPCDSIPPPSGLVIDGFVWYDLDRDGVREAGEPGIEAAQVELVSPCERLWVAHTDQSGYYKFVAGGCPVRAVVQTQPVFPVRTTPNPHPVDPAAVPPDGVLHVDFGIAPTRQP